MANTASAYGMVPVNLIGGRVFAGSTRMMPILSGYATSIFFGDVVKPQATGFIAKDTGTATLTPLGIFMGCCYIDPVLGFTNRQMWTASTATQNAEAAMAFVCDDPQAVFKIQGSAAMTQAMLWQNAPVVQGAGVATSGNSGVTLNAGAVTTVNTLPLRIIGWAGNNVNCGMGAGTPQETVVPTDLFPDVLVKWNFGTHYYDTATAVS